MKILYILKYWPVWGGGETVTLTLANEFARRGHSICIAYFEESLRSKADYIHESIREFKFPSSDHEHKKNVHFLRSIITEQHIDFIINQWGNLYTNLCAESKQGTNAKLIVCSHMALYTRSQITGYDIKSIAKRITYPIYRHLEKKRQIGEADRILSSCDKYIFLSESFINQYISIKNGNFEVHKLGFIPNPIPIIEEIYSSKKKQLLFVGRMSEPHKRVSIMMRVWKALTQMAGVEDWEFNLVGDGPDLEEMKRLAYSLKLDRIHFVGYQNPKQYYADASIFLMTSAFEGFGMTLVESLQNRVVPVVMDSFLALHDIIRDQMNGIIIHNGDEDAFIDALHLLMTNPSQLKMLSDAGPTSISKFEVGSIANQWEALFSQVL